MDDVRPGLLLLGGVGATPLLRDLTRRTVAAARARRMRVHLTDTEAAVREGPGAPEGVDAVSAVDFQRPDECVAWAHARRAAGERFDVVLGLREYAQVATAEVAAALGLPGNPPDAIRTVRTKDACRSVLAAAGFPQPAFRVCADEGQARDFLASFPGPWIAKPRNAMGSVGVTRVDDPADLPRAITALPDPGLFLLEQYVEGPEYSVEGVFIGGEPRILAITGKEILPSSFVEIGHVQPAMLDAAVSAEIETTVAGALRTLALRFGVFHVELWLTGQGVVLGEVHGRAGGDWIHLLLARTQGADMYGMVYDDALGRGKNTTTATAAPHAAAVRFFAPAPGQLRSIEGFDAAIRHPAVVHSELKVAVGDTIPPLDASDDRVGSLVVEAATPAAAVDLAARLISSVRFITE